MVEISPSHHPTIPLSRHLTISPSHHLTIPPSHSLTIPPPHHLTISPYHHLTISPSHHLTIPPSHHSTISPSNHPTIPPFHHTGVENEVSELLITVINKEALPHNLARFPQSCPLPLPRSCRSPRSFLTLQCRQSSGQSWT